MTKTFEPVGIRDRVQTLDVVRGFALLGIGLMNVEFFSRPLAELGAGMVAGLSGAEYWVSWCIHTFVRGKFWTMFSILFGMGFAVMLERARDAGRGFVRPYLRRALGLAVFGALHGVLVWHGDILLAYATGALALLLTLFGRFRQGLVAAGIIAGGAFVLKLPGAMGFVVAIAVSGLVGAYLRGSREVTLLGHRWPLWDAVTVALGALLGMGALLGIALAAPYAGGLAFAGVTLVAFGWLSRRFRDPVDMRSLRAGAALYLAPFLAMTLGAAVALGVPRDAPPAPSEQATQAIEADKAEQRRKVATEIHVMRGQAYLPAVAYRARHFSLDYVNQSGFMIMLLGLFLVGMWFVQSGAMMRPGRHLPLFRWLAWVGLPVGMVLAVAGSLVATHHVPNHNDLRWQLATGLQMLGNLPMSLGYMAVIVLGMQRDAWRKRLSWLAPAGRMALTNYIMQSLLGTVFFYGYGLAQWGLPRTVQALYVLVVFGLQLVLSRWWLANYRFGPLEWAWRWLTYGNRPQWRVER